MNDHEFIFKPGIWIGEGKITFSVSSEHLHFYTKWRIEKVDNQSIIKCSHEVEIQGGGDNVINHLSFHDLTATTFRIRLQNELVGEEDGKGIVDAKTIAWEYRENLDFEGFEVYELQENGDYMVHAEYASKEHRTIIDGRIWKKSTDNL